VGSVRPGELPVDPFALRRELNRLAQSGGGEAHRIEARTGFSALEVAHFIIETTPQALYAALLAEGLHGIVQQLKDWVRPPRWCDPDAPRTREEVLADSLRRAEYLARDTYRIHFEPLTVASHSLSETANLEEATAMVVFIAQDGSVISVHLWVADGATRHTISRVPRLV
jgi:hypothetical protein